MNGDASKVDAQAFLEKVAGELARRFERGLPIADGRPHGQVGPPFCAVCSTPGHCAKTCSPHAKLVRESGADRIGGAPGIGRAETQTSPRSFRTSSSCSTFCSSVR